MREIRQLSPEEFDAYIDIFVDAYPGAGINGEADRERYRRLIQKRHQEESVHLYGLFEKDSLLGVMRLYDFQMKLHEATVTVGGLGGVAVHLMHRKRKVARDMMLFYLRHYRLQGACLATLYPFRPDFYRRMGFGYGTKMNQYRVLPASLPRQLPHNVSFLTRTEKELLRDCYHRYMAMTSGLFERPTYELDAIFDNGRNRVAVFREEGRISGYVIFRFEKGAFDHFISNNIHVFELVYEHPAALRALLAFLRTQADQVERIILNSQDDNLHFLLPDPLNGSGNILPSVYHESNTQGVGIMYRVIDVPRLFEMLHEHNFGGQTCHLLLQVNDSFLPENDGCLLLSFQEGRAKILERGEAEVSVEMDVAEFSSLITGAVSFRQLHQIGLAQLSDLAYIESINRLFYAEHKPLCMTPF